MPLLVGLFLPIVIGLFATLVGLDRDRAFYPTVTIVIALLYALFAAIGESPHAFLLESLPAALFIIAAVVAFKWSLWVAVVALAAHGVFDSIHQPLIANPGVPVWWPEFCLAYDVVAAVYLAWLLKSGRTRVAAV